LWFYLDVVGCDVGGVTATEAGAKTCLGWGGAVLSSTLALSTLIATLHLVVSAVIFYGKDLVADGLEDKRRRRRRLESRLIRGDER
jgi:hypothetical protein